MPQPSRSSTIIAPVLCVLAAMVSIQVGASLAKGLLPSVGAAGLTALRLGFATLILGAVFRPWRARMTAKSWVNVLVYGAALGVMNLLFYKSIQTIPLGIAVALEFTGPLAIAIVMSRKPIDFLWAALAVTGLALLLLPSDTPTGPLDPAGVLYGLGAGVCWAGYILFGQRAGADHGMQTAALGMLVAAILIMPIGIASAGAALLSPKVLPLALAVAVLSSAAPYSLEMFALTRLPTKTFGALMSVEPVFGALAGLVLLGEVLSVTQWLAIAAVIAASAGAAVTAAQAVRREMS